MKKLVLLFMLLAGLLPTQAPAQVITVKSGEHDGFTRLVLEAGAAVDWQFGRTPDGYALQLDREKVRYDLTQVFDLISRNRLAAIWADPGSGNLQLGIACACHAIPFEFRPGVIVIDLRAGPPPPGSSFEAALPQSSATAPAPPFDGQAAPKPAAVAVPFPIENPDLAPLRATMLLELSEGVARGVVNLSARPEPSSAAPLPGALKQIRIGEDLGIVVGRQRDAAAARGSAACPKDDQLDIAAWGHEAPVIGQMAPALTGLTGEFDRPDPAAVETAVRFYLYLGFGREARQLLTALGSSAEDRALWEGMAVILDDGGAPDSLFTGMQNCETAAAMWSLLARLPDPGAAAPNSPAILRAFSALPLHLRRHLGPVLTERFLDRGETDSARALRAAILRAPGDPGPGVRLMAAEIDSAQGDHAAAEAALTALSGEAGPTTAEATLALATALIDTGKPVDRPLVLALAALAFEQRGTDLGDRLQQSHVLALAASGDFDAAFADPARSTPTTNRLWQLLAVTAPDAALLHHAVLERGAIPPDLAPDTRRNLARRLLDLGFGQAALDWLADGTNAGAWPEEDRLLAARAALQQGDARAALRHLAGIEVEGATLRAEALARLGDPAAITAFATLGDTEAELRAARSAGEWRRIAASGDDGWQAAAAALVTPAATVSGAPPGPLQRGQNAITESAAARSTVLALLEQAPGVAEDPAPEN